MNTPLPTIQNQVAPDVIDLGLGDPPLSLLPLDLIREAAQTRLSQNDNSFLQYGAEQGDGYFRLALADFLSKGYGFEVKPESLFVTNGISKALDLICTLFTQSGDTIFVEEPTYFLALRIFADHNLKVISIDTDENGLIIESLEEKLAEFRPKFLYLIPTFQNPTGTTLPQERRERLVQLAGEQDFIIAADEVYHLLSYTQKPPKSFAAYIDIENVISLGSFSKILAPGLRLGWLQAHPEKIRRFNTCGFLDSGGGLNPFTSAIVSGVIESGGLENNINKLINIYRSRIKVMDSALHQHLPDVKYSIPHGGYFFWLRLPEELDAKELRKKTPAFKVDLRPGALFSSKDGLKNYIRLCFVHYEEEDIEEGVLRLKQCLESK
ncbi:MAG: PLP-dependent aminotransferase family protein [Anaerolineae bacterium]|nr:PLP-dependent aminotransferase family protein [Anaerolineae bacterium]MCI0608992.1 PLP-dependent aminotransferase family protein [Anaerolineae bacterium]